MRLLRILLGLVLFFASANVAFFAADIVDSSPAAGFIAIAFAVMIFLAGVGTFLHGVSPDESIPRRIALVNLSLAALIAAVAALTIANLVGRDPDSEFPWLAPFYGTIFVAAIVLAPIAFWKAVRLEELPEFVEESSRPFDPFDPEEPAEEMIEPDPGPTPELLLARKRSLNLARAR
jgi:hypothetical protein